MQQFEEDENTCLLALMILGTIDSVIIDGKRINQDERNKAVALVTGDIASLKKLRVKDIVQSARNGKDPRTQRALNDIALVINEIRNHSNY